MIGKNVYLRRIKRIAEQLKNVQSNDDFYVQNISNCNSDAFEIADDLFGEKNEYSKTLKIAARSKLNDQVENILEVLESMEKRLSFTMQTDGNISSSIVDWRSIHPTIIKVSKRKFVDGHYADSVESAFKEINKIIKYYYREKTGKDSDGTDLMWKVFALSDPLILIGDLATESGRNVQEGYQRIFAGSMQAIRNPCAHENLVISDIEAEHLLFLASLLMYKIDSKKNSTDRLPR